MNKEKESIKVFQLYREILEKIVHHGISEDLFDIDITSPSELHSELASMAYKEKDFENGINFVCFLV